MVAAPRYYRVEMKRRKRNKLPEYNWKEIEKLLERAEPLLGEGELEDIKDACTYARLRSNRTLRDKIGGWLTAAIADAGDVPPFKPYDGGTPPLDVQSHSVVCGMTGVGKTVFSNIQILQIVKEL